LLIYTDFGTFQTYLPIHLGEACVKRMHDIFGPGSNPERRIFLDYEELRQQVDALRKLELKIVLTSGTFDLFHIGHSRYLEAAKEHGDILIVGVDSDAKTRARKGPNRPIVSEKERMEILCHTRHVDLVFLKQPEEEAGKLILTVCPDVLIRSETSSQSGECEMYEDVCGKIVVLKPQATTSTTARLRKLLVDSATNLKGKLEELTEALDEFIGGKHE
jgi:D-glycero-beta-D-manno-heptose 1-phosphate adenylyltransferase